MWTTGYSTHLDKEVSGAQSGLPCYPALIHRLQVLQGGEGWGRGELLDWGVSWKSTWEHNEGEKTERCTLWDRTRTVRHSAPEVYNRNSQNGHLVVPQFYLIFILLQWWKSHIISILSKLLYWGVQTPNSNQTCERFPSVENSGRVPKWLQNNFLKNPNNGHEINPQWGSLWSVFDSFTLVPGYKKFENHWFTIICPGAWDKICDKAVIFFMHSCPVDKWVQ